MPIYEYRCEACSRLFEVYRRLAERDQEQACPSCGGRARREEIVLFRAAGGAAKTSCGGGPRRSPFS